MLKIVAQLNLLEHSCQVATMSRHFKERYPSAPHSSFDTQNRCKNCSFIVNKKKSHAPRSNCSSIILLLLLILLCLSIPVTDGILKRHLVHCRNNLFKSFYTHCKKNTRNTFKAVHSLFSQK